MNSFHIRIHRNRKIIIKNFNLGDLPWMQFSVFQQWFNPRNNKWQLKPANEEPILSD